MLLILPPHPFPPSHPWFRRFPWGGGGEWGFGPSRAECIKETNKTSMSVVVVVVFSVVKKMGRNGIFFLQFFFNFSISRKQMGVFFFFLNFVHAKTARRTEGGGGWGICGSVQLLPLGQKPCLPALHPDSPPFKRGSSRCVYFLPNR